MKKYCLISFVSILFIGGLFVTSKLIVNDPYVLFNANVEALSNEESSSGIFTCHNDYFYKEGYSVRDCGNCSMQYDHKASFGHYLTYVRNEILVQIYCYYRSNINFL